METTGVLNMELVDHLFSKYCQQKGLIKREYLEHDGAVRIDRQVYNVADK